MNTLYAISYSPWSEKARWALDHHRLPYRERGFVPMLSTPWLRLRLRRPLGRVTVPTLITADRGSLSESYDIARFCEETGFGAALFPDGQEDKVARFDALSEAGCGAGRALATASIGSNSKALQEAVPKLTPGPLRGPLGRTGVMYLQRKYRLGAQDERTHRAELERVLGMLRDTLDGRSTLLGAFSYADIAMAATLQLVAPISDRFIQLGPHTRVAMTDARVVEAYPDLLAWRDALYENYR